MASKCVPIELDKITSNEPRILKDIFKAILHSIFYHRAIGPLDQLNYLNCDVLKITYVNCVNNELKSSHERYNDFSAFSCLNLLYLKFINEILKARCGDQQIEQDVNEKWVEFYSKLTKAGKGTFTVEVEFFEKKKVKKYMFFSEQDEDVVFEKWRITFGVEELNKDREDQPIRADVLVRAEKMLNELLMKIIEYSNKYTDYLPDFNPKEVGDKIAIYKYNVLVGQEQKGILDMFKK